ncbi:glycosyltransferase family 1 protein [Phocaeicola sp.]|uniref:glycosyltransferase family 4 protein n=1 Tax=Phocaeicola sp. TaxID=2773926 RepID=UPI0023C1B3C8|nr:glycosyltransferase family 1 protein [Phocaeicola sp.]MDE5677368.1 glycosyltransferase family 4 protein [Phocaeicola sp.]
MKTKIVISAVNLVEGGPLTILRSCLKALSDYSVNNNIEVLALVHKKDLCSFPNIIYIEVPWAKNNWICRVFCEYFYFKKISRKIKPYLWLSLHDISPNVKAVKRAVYCHNPTPFYTPKISDLWCNYKEFFFSLFYRYLYQINIHRNDFIIVQQNWLREAFSNMFSLDKKKIIVAIPECQNLQIENKKESTLKEKYTFFFPAYPRSFKNFEVICKACRILEKENNNRYNVVLTLKGNENRYAKLLYKQYSSLKTITFGGLLSYEEVCEKYNRIDCLIFPSKLETWGLPVSEFVSFDKPMLIADLPYAHETAAGAKSVAFFNPDDPKMLADRMREAMNNNMLKFSSVPLVNIELPNANSWEMLFDKLLVDND